MTNHFRSGVVRSSLPVLMAGALVLLLPLLLVVFASKFQSQAWTHQSRIPLTGTGDEGSPKTPIEAQALQRVGRNSGTVNPTNNSSPELSLELLETGRNELPFLWFEGASDIGKGECCELELFIDARTGILASLQFVLQIDRSVMQVMEFRLDAAMVNVDFRGQALSVPVWSDSCVWSGPGGVGVKCNRVPFAKTTGKILVGTLRLRCMQSSASRLTEVAAGLSPELRPPAGVENTWPAPKVPCKVTLENPNDPEGDDISCIAELRTFQIWVRE